MSIITSTPRRSKSERYLAERHTKREESVARSPTPAAIPRSRKKTTKSGKSPKKKLTKEEKRKRYLKWLFWILIAVAFYFSFGWLRREALLLLQMNPTVWAFYKAIEAEIASRSLLGLFYASFFGALFFIALPVEIIFLYYLGLNYYFVQVLTITLIGNLLGISVDYFIGWLLGPKVLQWFMKKETYATFHKKIQKAGAFFVIIGNIIPFPIEPFTVFLGALRYGYFRLMLWTFVGKLVKFGLLWLGYKYFVQYVGPYISTVNLPWFVNLIKSGFSG